MSRVIPARGSQENDGVVVGSDGFSVHCLKACAVSLLGATRCWPQALVFRPHLHGRKPTPSASAPLRRVSLELTLDYQPDGLQPFETPVSAIDSIPRAQHAVRPHFPKPESGRGSGPCRSEPARCFSGRSTCHSPTTHDGAGLGGGQEDPASSNADIAECASNGCCAAIGVRPVRTTYTKACWLAACHARMPGPAGRPTVLA